MSRYFTYDKTSPNADQYEILQTLMERWENEIVEIKEAKGQFNEDTIGRYFSAISNEANLKNQQFGWLIFGVSEQDKKHLVGTHFKEGNPTLLEKFKHTISIDSTDGITFLDIFELFPEYEGKKFRVLMFQIPAAVAGIPTEWKTRSYARSGESLVILPQFKVDIIRQQQRRDFSSRILEESNIDCIDPEALILARTKYKEKMNRAHITEEIDQLTDEQFLTKLRLMKDGKLTAAGLLLLGKPEKDYLLGRFPTIQWRLLDKDGMIKDYEIFHIPFILVGDKVLAKIRNLTYRYMPNQQTLFTSETQQYDPWLLLELLNNCIAHSDYQVGDRIYVNEMDDSIVFTNPGSFLPQSVEAVLQPFYAPPFYRNQLLADAMVNFHMIDTATSGIKKVYRIQKDKYFPLPDFDLQDSHQVKVTVYGKILDEKYTQLLYANRDDLDLETVFLLDKVQKHERIDKKDADKLKKSGFVEGRYPNLYVSFKIADLVGNKADYVHNKGLDESVIRQLILEALRNGPATAGELLQVVDMGALSSLLTKEQKKRKVSNLIQKMKKDGLIDTDKVGRYAKWHLVQNDNN
jgi:ATP-dependent DNA helicase RecG